MLRARFRLRGELLETEINSLDAQLAQLTAAASPQLSEAFRDRRRHGRRAASGRRRQPRPAPLRGRLLDALRLLTDPRLLRPDAPSPAQPRRQPPSQRGALPD